MLRHWVCLLILFQLFSPFLYSQELPRGLQLRVSRQNNFTYSTMMDLRQTWEKGRYQLELNFHHDNLYNSFRSQDPFVQFYLRTHIWQHYQWKEKVKTIKLQLQLYCYTNSINSVTTGRYYP